MLAYYEDSKADYVRLARELYRTIQAPGGDEPLIGDVFVMVFGALKAHGAFIEALLQHGVNLERAANKWFSYFAWLVVLENWPAIKSGRRRR